MTSKCETTIAPVDVVVVGSLNIDYTTTVRSIPRPGETVLGDDVTTFMGGKGLNQAVAAARAGASVAMVGRVGDDDAGSRLRDRLRSEGVDDTWISVDRHTPSGAAFITVADDSENAIVVSPGANATLDVDHVAAAAATIGDARVALVQLEVPMAAVVAATQTAHGTVIVNPAPARPLPEAVLDRAGILVPNRSELAAIAGTAVPRSETQVAAVASTLAAEWGGRPDDGAPSPATIEARRIIVTLGADGVFLIDGVDSQQFGARPVDAVDTTGAGDCFCGSLAARLALGDALDDSIRWAMTAAAISVTRAGASDSMPTFAEVEEARQQP